MSTHVFHSIGKFFAGTGEVLATPSGDARGHVRVYTTTTVTRGRDF